MGNSNWAKTGCTGGSLFYYVPEHGEKLPKNEKSLRFC